MDVSEAVTSRRAVRGFTDQPVSREVLQRSRGPKVSYTRTGRAPFGETVMFVDG